ncbi:carboxypeptidase-like regulatory domain-containing protein [bacterium SCSIO 12741]|nr:carboxypeptidase-like regulatory domain-containing protein [bacterium SCSIO 12741]
MRWLFLFSLFLGALVPSGIHAQNLLSGKIIDSKTKEPLPFVNLVDTVNNYGTSSDIDGYFELNSFGQTRYLKLSYVGYETQIFDVGSASQVTIKLVKKSYSLKPVEVFPGENPAHRIVARVYNNRDLNNPEKNGSFTYETYNKFVVTADIDTTKPPRILEIDSSRLAQLDTSEIPEDFDASEFENDQFLKDNDLEDLENDTVTTQDLAEYIQNAHLFLMESVTYRKYRPPNRDKEVVLASRVSGLKSAQFAAIARQMQSFTFYEENFYLGDREYLNPISKNSTKKYLFILEDTVVNEPDTTFILSFRPRTGKKFDGLRGLLYINTQGYAVEKVLAEPSEYLEGANITIQQNYELVDKRKWFPVQLKSEIYFMFDTTPDSDRLIGRLNGYIENIELDPVLKKREFNHVVVEMDPMASAQTPEFWESKRRGEFTYKDSNTYHIIDSIGKELNFERNLYILNALFSGQVPYKFINFDLNRLMRFNGYEGLGLGLGAHTNDKFSQHVKFGAISPMDSQTRNGNLEAILVTNHTNTET